MMSNKGRGKNLQMTLDNTNLILKFI